MNLTILRKRVILFKQWYTHLRQEGIRMYGEDQTRLPYYARYSKFNCFKWAISNSGTHNIDGNYRDF